jgi:chromosome segregation ATPase
MPQIKQLQLVWWGPFRPDPIELARDGINVLTGLNGVGKTCLLDAVKLMLGVDDLKAKPGSYVFSGGDGSERVEKAYIKAVFDNPERPRNAGRVFADAGWGCNETANVTAVCEVTRNSRRYAIFPGYLAWGENGRSLSQDLAELGELKQSRWLGPRNWSGLLARAGVPRALLGVIALKQGETDKALDASPEQLLREMLELTGKQETLDNFRTAKTDLAEARSRYDESMERLKSEKRQLENLAHRVARHEEYQDDRRRIENIEQVQLPLARRRELESRIAGQRREFDQRLEALRTASHERDRAEAQIPELEQQEQQLTEEAAELRQTHEQASAALQKAAGQLGATEIELERATAALAAGEGLGALNEATLAQLTAQARQAQREVEDACSEQERLGRELEELRAGKPIRPAGLDEFRSALAAEGIDAQLVAEQLEVSEALAAEAVLGDGVWALVVDERQFEQAVELARRREYRLPLVRAGQGEPRGALAGGSGLPEALAYLEEIDLPLDEQPGVSGEGLVRGRQWAALRAPERAVLGERARVAAIAEREARQQELDEQLPQLKQQAANAEQAAQALGDAIEAEQRLPGLRQAQQEQAAARETAERQQRTTQQQLEDFSERLGVLKNTLDSERDKLKATLRLVRDYETRAQSIREQIQELEGQLEKLPRPDEAESAGELPSVEVLEHQLTELSARLERFSEEERSSLVVAEHAEQSERVGEVEVLIADRETELEGVTEQVERARRRYDEHIRQIIHLLGRGFRDICQQAGMEGELELRPSTTHEDEFALDVRVAHLPGDPKLSYQSHRHSGGQKAKISILLLLAAMSSEGAADLLIIDEHSAHLDSQNIDYVGEVMRALRSRVQFILALPANAEARRLEWADQQFVLLPRKPGETYTPPLRVITRTPERGDRYAEIGQLGLAG